MRYQDKLKSPKWQKKRLEILQRDSFTCQMCGDEKTELHVHHIKYTNEPYDAPNENLQTLCKHCHYLESYAHKMAEKVIFVHKLLDNVFCKFQSGKILISNIDENNNMKIGLLLKEPKSFMTILSALIK